MTLRHVQETTKWSDGSTCNHQYLLEGQKILAFRPAGGQVQYLSGAMRINTKGRTFEPIPVRSSPFQKVRKSTTILVQGSKGNQYHLDPVARTCSCPGFSFRGTCKHLALLP
jgi:hypothetical protein